MARCICGFPHAHIQHDHVIPATAAMAAEPPPPPETVDALPDTEDDSREVEGVTLTGEQYKRLKTQFKDLEGANEKLREELAVREDAYNAMREQRDRLEVENDALRTKLAASAPETSAPPADAANTPDATPSGAV